MRGACRLYELQNENELLAMEMRLTEDQAEKKYLSEKTAPSTKLSAR